MIPGESSFETNLNLIYESPYGYALAQVGLRMEPRQIHEPCISPRSQLRMCFLLSGICILFGVDGCCAQISAMR
jgi:hypothetical protein